MLREGINLTKISLPVKVFEPRSFLQRVTDNWAYIDLLEKAVYAKDPIERLQYVVSIAWLLGEAHHLFQVHCSSGEVANTVCS